MCLSHQSGTVTESGTYQCQLWKMGEMELSISADQSDPDSSIIAYRSFTWLLRTMHKVKLAA